MSALLLALALAAAPVAKPHPLQFIEDDFPTALAMAKKGKVPLFVDAWAPWCHTCVFMKEHVLNKPSLGKHGQRFVFVSLDTEKAKNADFLKKFPVESWPSLFIIDSATETLALQWLGSVNEQQFEKLLEDGEAAVKNAGGDSADAKLATADRLYGARKNVEAAAAYRAALAAAKPEWDRRPRTVESLMNALYSSKAFEDCATTAAKEAPTLPKGPSFANTVLWGLSCASSADEKAAWKPATETVLFDLSTEAVKVPGLLADDRSGVYELRVDFLESHEKKPEARKEALEWLAFLEGEAKAAKTPAARAVFDPHRLNAALAAGVPERVVPALLQSEKDLPADYNPPARLAIAYREQGKFDDALKSADKALSKVYGPRKMRVLDTKASILTKKGDLPAARKVKEEALAWAKGLPESQRPMKMIARLEGELNPPAAKQ